MTNKFTGKLDDHYADALRYFTVASNFKKKVRDNWILDMVRQKLSKYRLPILIGFFIALFSIFMYWANFVMMDRKAQIDSVFQAQEHKNMTELLDRAETLCGNKTIEFEVTDEKISGTCK